jgi:hypothetical protein
LADFSIFFFKKTSQFAHSNRWILLLLFFVKIGAAQRPTAQNAPKTFDLPENAGVALSTRSLFPDTLLSSITTEMVKEGDFLTILGQSALEHLDKDQNQKFHWFEVKTLDGRTGWMFGDGIAVLATEERIPVDFKRFSKKTASFSAGFESSIVWFASVEGRDNLYPQDYMNPLYDEQYLVITNPRGRSVVLRVSGASASGRTDLLLLNLMDLTGDNVPEIIVENASFSPTNPLEDRELNIFSLQTGTISKIFEERLTLSTDENTPSPALFKSIELESKSLRIEYIDFVEPEKYTLHQPLDRQVGVTENALELVTWTLEWNPKNNRFESLYDESRLAPKGMVSSAIRLKTRPDLYATSGLMIQPTDKLLIIKELEQFFVENGQKKMRPWLYVKSPNGALGYVEARLIKWQNTRHAPVLEAYFQNPPLVRTDWMMTGFPFLKFSQPGE